jgi:Urb2/Npa2 family
MTSANLVKCSTHMLLVPNTGTPVTASLIKVTSNCREVDEALRPGVYSLIDICTQSDLQQLHTLLGGKLSKFCSLSFLFQIFIAAYLPLHVSILQRARVEVLWLHSYMTTRYISSTRGKYKLGASMIIQVVNCNPFIVSCEGLFQLLIYFE